MTSTINPLNTAAAEGKKPVKTGHTANPGSATPEIGADFALLFANMMAGVNRQDLAAGEGSTSPPAPDLAAQALSPGVNIITTSKPAMSDASLMAFAKAQGLDESAMALIFEQKNTAAPAPVSDLSAGMPQQAQPVGLDPAGLEAAALNTAVPNTVAPNATTLNTADQPKLAAQAALSAPISPPEQQNNFADTASLMQAKFAAQSAPQKNVELQLDAETTMKWSLTNPAAASNNTAQPVAPLSPAPVPTDAAGLAAAASAVQAHPAAGAELLKPVFFGLNGVRSGASSEVKPEQVAASDDGAPNDFAATMLLRGEQVTQFTKQFQARSNNGRAADDKFAAKLATTAAPLATSSQPDNASTDNPVQESMDLDAHISGADLQAIWSNRLASHAGSREASTNNTPAAATTGSDAELRAEQYEKISQRLAEALGQRLSAQISRGNWKVELVLKPHDLGNIDVQLNMKGGELEASFKASHPMTQELIASGLPRLKEVLNDLGMDIASMNVNIWQNSQNGGNSTPGQQQSRQPNATNVNGDIANKVVTPAAPSHSGASDDTDGLDILV